MMVVPDETNRFQTLLLVAQKDEVERKISEFGLVLEANNVGMTGSLVDDEGFPRRDIDVYQVRHARHQIICLQNDLQALMKEIEKGLEEVHAEGRRREKGHANPKFDALEKAEEEVVGYTTQAELRSFVKVDMISPGSPADDAGLMVNDEIIEFGSINCNNFINLNTIAEVIKHCENQRIQIKVKRGHLIIEMNLVPCSWHGRGLLGCNIVLLNSNSTGR